MRLSEVATKLKEESSIAFVAHGNSMTPRIRSGDKITVEAITDYALVKKGDVVLAKVHGRWFLHLVSATEDKRVQISNNHGHVNGWAMRSSVVGRLREEKE